MAAMMKAVSFFTEGSFLGNQTKVNTETRFISNMYIIFCKVFFSDNTDNKKQI